MCMQGQLQFLCVLRLCDSAVECRANAQCDERSRHSEGCISCEKHVFTTPVSAITDECRGLLKQTLLECRSQLVHGTRTSVALSVWWRVHKQIESCLIRALPVAVIVRQVILSALILSSVSGFESAC
jgi:hypothetical protein